jgi:hypothetical protein
MTYTFDIKTMRRFNRVKGQIFIDIPIVCEGSIPSDKIKFIYDTGAYITVINRRWYEWFNLDNLPRFDTTLGGYIGFASGYVFQIPGLVIGRRLLKGVWAFTPRNIEIEHNLLGDNVLEYFMPFQDNMNDCIYFPDNLNPEPYIHPETNFSLACDGVLYAGDSY